MHATCDSCEFFQPEREWTDVNQVKVYTLPGGCHIRSVNDDQWPTRESDDWCGEHEPKSTQAEPEPEQM